VLNWTQLTPVTLSSLRCRARVQQRMAADVGDFCLRVALRPAAFSGG